MSTIKKAVSKKTKTILITGVAGFVGTSMAQRQLEKGHEVHGVDNLITGSWQNVLSLKEYPEFTYSTVDVADAGTLFRTCTSSYDEIYHFACPTGVPNIKKYGEEMMRTCSTGTENVLCLARQNNAPVLYTSSAEVYGDPLEFPQTEHYNGNVNPVGDRSTYEEGKRFGEMLVRLYADKYQVQGKIVRIFNSYGPFMSRSDTRLIPNSLAKVQSGSPLVIYGDGEQTRTHLHISDLLNGLEKVMADGEVASPYNIGGDKQMSINQLIGTLKDVLDENLLVQYEEHYIEDHNGREPDVSRVKALGWSSKVSLFDGLTDMCTAYGIVSNDEGVVQQEKKGSWTNGAFDNVPA